MSEGVHLEHVEQYVRKLTERSLDGKIDEKTNGRRKQDGGA